MDLYNSKKVYRPVNLLTLLDAQTVTPMAYNFLGTIANCEYTFEGTTYELLDGHHLYLELLKKYASIKVLLPWTYDGDGWTADYTLEDQGSINAAAVWIGNNIQRYLQFQAKNFFKVYRAMVLSEYDPVYNYDRTEVRTLTKEGTETLTKEGSETLTRGGTETHTNSVDANDPVTSKGYNTQMDVVTESEVNKSVSTGTTTDSLAFTNRTDSTSFNDRKDVTSFGDRVDTEEIRAYGNIGVTTSQQMEEAAIALASKGYFTDWVVQQIVRDLFVF